MHLGKPLGATRRAADEKPVNVLKTYEIVGEKMSPRGRYGPAKRFVVTGPVEGN